MSDISYSMSVKMQGKKLRSHLLELRCYSDPSAHCWLLQQHCHLTRLYLWPGQHGLAVGLLVQPKRVCPMAETVPLTKDSAEHLHGYYHWNAINKESISINFMMEYAHKTSSLYAQKMNLSKSLFIALYQRISQILKYCIHPQWSQELLLLSVSKLYTSF